MKKNRHLRRISLGFIVLLSFVSAMYVLSLVFAPLLVRETDRQRVQAIVSDQKSNVREDRLYIPSIGLDLPIVQIAGDEAAALRKGAVQRSPASGNPRDGGNFVLAGHRFSMGVTPGQTRQRSPFYHIDALEPGQDIYVDYSGIRYAYRIHRRIYVHPDDVYIEERTDTATLTLYSCELNGVEGGREVVLAYPRTD